MTDSELQGAREWLANVEKYGHPKPRISGRHIVLLRKMVAEIERLREELADADTAMGKIASGWPNYREIAAEYFRGQDAAEAADRKD